MADLHQLQSEAEEMEVKLACLRVQISQRQKDLQTENDRLKEALQVASARAQTAEDNLAACLEDARNSESQARERDQRSVAKIKELEAQVDAQVVDLQRKVLEESKLRRATEDKLKEAESELKAVWSMSTQAEERHAETVPSPRSTAASTTEHWQRRITEIVRAHPEGIQLNDLEWTWHQKYPNEDPQRYRPVAKLKNAVQNYVSAVAVDSDLNVHLRERSRGPRPSCPEDTASPVANLSAHEAFLAVAAQFVSGILEAGAGQASSSAHQFRQPGTFNQRQLDLIGEYARSAWKLDPAQCTQALEEWGESITNVEIDLLHQTHDTVGSTFAHGPHKGRPVGYLVHELTIGVVVPGSLTPLVVARFRGKLWVVFGNRRLHALKKARQQGLQHSVVPAIVHDLGSASHLQLGDKLIPFFCKFFSAMTTHNEGQLASLRGTAGVGSSGTAGVGSSIAIRPPAPSWRRNAHVTPIGKTFQTTRPPQAEGSSTAAVPIGALPLEAPKRTRGERGGRQVREKGEKNFSEVAMPALPGDESKPQPNVSMARN